VFFNRYGSLDCCTVLLGKIFSAVFVVVMYLVVLFIVFHSLWSDLFYNVDVYLLLDVDTVRYFILYCFYTVF